MIPKRSNGTFAVPDEDGFDEKKEYWYLNEYDEPIYDRHFNRVTRS